MSMSVLPNVGGSESEKMALSGKYTEFYYFKYFLIHIAIQGSKSTNDTGNMFKSQLMQLKKNLEKKTSKARGISQYLDNASDDDDDEFSDDDDALEGDKSMMAEKDPSKLIDLELVKLLKYCHDLKNQHKETMEYQEEVMMKSVELGKKSKEKTLILDMDETMIAAKFNCG